MISFSKYNNESSETIIKIIGAADSKSGVDAEFEYIASVKGNEGVDWIFNSQELIYQSEKQVDAIKIKLRNNSTEIFNRLQISCNNVSPD